MNNIKATKNFDNLYNTNNSMTSSNNGFRKEGLEFLKKKYKKTTDDFIKATYPKKDQANMRVKISRLINKPENAPGYFDVLELSNQLSAYFNQFTTNGDAFIGSNFFLGRSAYIDIVGAIFGNGQIGMFAKKDIKKCAVPIRHAGANGVISKVSSTNGLIRLYKPHNKVHTGADGRFGIAQDKKSKIVYSGFIDPRSNGNYNILDKSYSTGKTIGLLAEDITLSWSSRMVSSFYPDYYDY